MKYGPNTAAVERFIEQARGMTGKQRKQLDRLTWENQKNAAQAWAVAYSTKRTLLVLTRNRWTKAQNEIRELGLSSAVDVALHALVLRGVLSEAQFGVLYGPWARVFGWPE